MTKRVSSQPFDCHTQKIKETKLPSPPLKRFFILHNCGKQNRNLQTRLLTKRALSIRTKPVSRIKTLINTRYKTNYECLSAELFVPTNLTAVKSRDKLLQFIINSFYLTELTQTHGLKYCYVFTIKPSAIKDFLMSLNSFSVGADISAGGAFHPRASYLEK